MSNPSDRPRARADAGAPSALHRILLGLAVVGLAALRNRGHDRSPVPEEAPPASAPPQGGDKRARAEAETALAPERAAEPGRGRDARAPTEIPSRGWKDILWRVYEEIEKDRIIAVAAGVTFYALLALFPAVAALVSIYGLFADGMTIQQNLKTIAVVLPGGALDMIGDQVARITAKPNATLGFAFFSGLAISLWSANAGMKAMFDALNVAYGEDEKRSFLGLNLRSLGFTLAAILFIVVALFGVVAIPVMLSFIGLGTATEWLVSLARWPVLLAVTVAGLAVLYRYGPSRTEAKWRWITPGSTLRRGGLDRGLDAVLLVRGELRQLQRDLWLAGRGGRVHDLDLAVDHRRPARRRDQRRDRAPDRGQLHRSCAEAARRAGRAHGRYRRRGEIVIRGSGASTP